MRWPVCWRVQDRESTVTVEQALQFFQSGLQAGRIAQSYLVTGPPLGGAGAFATGAIQALFCPGRPDGGAACGHCPACRRVAERREPDVLWVEPTKKSRIISVDQVRDEILPRINQTAFSGGWKVVVLVHADRLNASAANAFLKTLEEPPARCLILLLTDRPESLLPTILSRCQRVAIHTGEADRRNPELEAELAAILEVDEMTSYTARAVRGDRVSGLLKRLVGEALKAAGDEEGDEDADKETLEAREAMIRKGIRTEVLQVLQRRYRDILILTCAPRQELLYDPAREADLRRVADGTTLRKALADIGRIETMNRLLERNLPEALVFSRGFAELN